MAGQLILYSHGMSRGRISGGSSKRSGSPAAPSCLTTTRRWRARWKAAARSGKPDVSHARI